MQTRLWMRNSILLNSTRHEEIRRPIDFLLRRKKINELIARKPLPLRIRMDERQERESESEFTIAFINQSQNQIVLVQIQSEKGFVNNVVICMT